MSKNNDSRKPKNSMDDGTLKKLKIATYIVGIAAILVFFTSFALTATSGRTNLIDKAPAVLLIPLVLTLVLPIVWGIIFVRYRKAATSAKQIETAKKQASMYGEIYCTQTQANKIGDIFNNRIDKCPVCGTAIEHSSDYVMHEQVHVRKKIEGVYVSRNNYSAEVEQAYETVIETKAFPNTERYYCPHCKWEALRGHCIITDDLDNHYGGNHSTTYYCKKFKKGNLYHKIELPKDEIY